MDINELIKELKEYNFLEKSVKSFSKEYTICEKTVLKYLRLNKIPYRKKGGNTTTCIPRDKLGTFALNVEKRLNETIRVFSNENIKKSNYEEEAQDRDIVTKLARKIVAKESQIIE